MIIHKTQSCGQSSLIPVFAANPKLQFYHLVCQPSEFIAFDSKFSMLICQVTMISQPEMFIPEGDIPSNVFVSGKRLSDIVDLSTVIFFVGFWNKDNKRSIFPLGCQVGKFAKWVFPNAMKIGFNEDSFPNMNTPAKVLFSSIHSNMLFNNVETVSKWLAGNRGQWDNDRRNN